ncbi:MAG: RNA polymerase sigma factor [Gemmatimonadota bacterium]
MPPSPRDLREEVERIYRHDSRRVLATLIRLLGDFDAAEEALHDAFVAAIERWPQEGMPANPIAWLVSTGRFKAIDKRRRQQNFDAKRDQLTYAMSTDVSIEEPTDDVIGDDRLRLIFTCCHPALSPDAQVALTLRTVGNLTTEEIAHAFLLPAPTLAQRIVRAKTKIRAAGIPYEIPAPSELPARLEVVLAVIYLIFNEGYSASSGASLTRSDLSVEAIRLGRLLVELSAEPEAMGLLAMMLLHDSRRAARVTPEGDLLLLDEQDRTRWNADQIAEGLALTEQTLRAARVGPYALQAAIAAVHAEAPRAEETDWRQIVSLYNVLLRIRPTTVVELNRAAAVAMSEGPEQGLELIDRLLGRGELSDYQPAHAARADLLRRLDRREEALEAYAVALRLTSQEAQRRFLERRIRELRA